MFLKETLTIAAYEGARVGIQSGGTDADATSRIQQVLDERSVTYDASSIQFSSPSFDTAEALQQVTVTVQVACDGNLPVSGNLFLGQSLSANVTLRKEFKNP